MAVQDLTDNKGSSYKKVQNKTIRTRNLCAKLAMGLVSPLSCPWYFHPPEMTLRISVIYNVGHC
jgi:hypothetical protein